MRGVERTTRPPEQEPNGEVSVLLTLSETGIVNPRSGTY